MKGCSGRERCDECPNKLHFVLNSLVSLIASRGLWIEKKKERDGRSGVPLAVVVQQQLRPEHTFESLDIVSSFAARGREQYSWSGAADTSRRASKSSILFKVDEEDHRIMAILLAS